MAAVLITVHSKGSHSTPQVQASCNSAKVEKVRRPTITSAGTSEQWSYFTTRWLDYVEATHIEGKEKVIQLLECYDEQLRKDLTRNADGSLTSRSTEEVLEAIKKLAVTEDNAMVARM